jgi:hypothetical protein
VIAPEFLTVLRRATQHWAHARADIAAGFAYDVGVRTSDTIEAREPVTQPLVDDLTALDSPTAEPARTFCRGACRHDWATVCQPD